LIVPLTVFGAAPEPKATVLNSLSAGSTPGAYCSFHWYEVERLAETSALTVWVDCCVGSTSLYHSGPLMLAPGGMLPSCTAFIAL
jgi:hypothetical protein